MADHDERYERSEFSVRLATLALAILSVTIIVVAAALWLLRQEFESETRGAPSAEKPALQEGAIEGPSLQHDPARDLARLRARHRQILTSTAWIDREAGIARIPIEHAMDMLAQEGWPGGPP